MVGVRMCDQDRIRVYSTRFARPIRAEIDHDGFAAPRDEQGRMHAVSRGSCVNLTPGT
jgi:hypothetical protein